MDTGAGLAPEKLTHLFQPFNRLGQESSAEEGTGIGLVMSKRLVEQMAGLVGGESAVGAGSTFWFELSSSTAPALAVDPGEPALLTFDAGRGLARVLESPVASPELADAEEIPSGQAHGSPMKDHESRRRLTNRPVGLECGPWLPTLASD